MKKRDQQEKERPNMHDDMESFPSRLRLQSKLQPSGVHECNVNIPPNGFFLYNLSPELEFQCSSKHISASCQGPFASA